MIRSYFNAEAESVKKRTDFDGHADPKLEEIAVDIECRKIQIDKLKQDDQGNEVVSSIEAWLPASLGRLPSESTIKFADNDKENKVISSELVSGLIADQFLRVYLK